MSSVCSGSSSRISSSIRRELLLCGLNKLEDRDTLKLAVEELNALIQNLDGQGVSSLVSCLCKVERNQKNYARKECLRLFVSLASSDCPARGVFLSPSVLSKTTRFLVQSFGDIDGGVRETASKTYAKVAKEWSLFHKQLIDGDGSSLFLRRLFKALVDPKKELQIAASDALRGMSPWVDSLSKELLKDCLRHLKNPTFCAKANLLQALASYDSESDQATGLAKGSSEAFRPLVVSFVGRTESVQSSGSGLLHLMFNPDWLIRKASVDCLRCLGMIFDSDLRDSKKLVSQIRESLHRQRFDRVKSVRDAVQQTIELYEEMAVSAQGGNASDSISDASTVAKTCPPKRADQLSTGTPALDRAPDEIQVSGGGEVIDNLDVEDIPIHSSVVMMDNPISERSDGKSAPKRTKPAGKNYLDRLKSTSRRSGMPATSPTLCPDTHLTEEWADGEELAENPRATDRDQIKTSINQLSNRVDGLRSLIQTELAEIKDSLKALQGSGSSSDIQNNTADHTEYLTSQERQPRMEHNLDDLFCNCLDDQLKLFRLMQRTPPSVHRLRQKTLQTLLYLFCSFMMDGRAITRILPWLWQLTTPAARSVSDALPVHLKDQILSSLSNLSSEQQEDQAQIDALEFALTKLWDLGDDYEWDGSDTT